MKETSFISQNKDKWRKFEELNKSQDSNPDELSELFVEITEDLSYARTFYPRRSVRVYLNGMAQNVFTSLYKIKKNPLGKFIDFWITGLPLEMYRARKNLLYAFIIFSVAALIGIASTENDINFARVILSDDYVEMTNDFIEEGDPMKVYKKRDSYEMFVSIFFNNIQVAFYCFILGIFFSFGTGFFMVYNGIMLGSFQSYFYYKGLTKSAIIGKQLLITTFLSIWIHGAFEISAIIIAGAAGLTLGNGLMFPGTFTRLQSLQISAKRGIKIMVGLIPFFFIAAVFESWVTRHTEYPIWLKLGIIILSFSIIITYFVIYPFIVARKNPDKVDLNEEPLYHAPIKVEKYKIRQINEVFSDSFSLYGMTMKFLSPVIWRVIIPLNLVFLVYLIITNTYFFGYDLSPGELIGGIYGIAHTYSPLNFLITMFIFWLNAVSVFHAISYAYEKDKKPFWKSWFNYLIKKGYRFILPIAAFFLFFLNGHFFMFFLGFMIFPIIQSTFVSQAEGKKNLFVDFKHGIQMGIRTWGNGFLLLLLFVIVSACFFMLFSGMAMITNIIIQTVEWHFVSYTDYFFAIKNGFLALFYIIFFQLIFPLYYFAYNLLYYAQEEKENAYGLFERLKRFGKVSKTHETEFDDED